MQKLHVLHTEASLGWGGQEIRILTEAAGTAARGHRVSLIAPAESNIYREACERDLAAVALPVGRKNLRGLLALRGWIKSNAPDVINTHSSTDSWLAALACFGLRLPPPLVRTRHISAAVPNNWSSRWLYRKATAFIATTGDALRDQIIAEAGVDPARVRSVPTGIDLARYKPCRDSEKAALRSHLNLPGDTPIVGIVATLRSWKGHRYLIEALEKMPGAMLVIVGDGPQRDTLVSQVATLKLQDRVRFSGNQKDVVPWLQAFDVFALPSYANEGVPQAIMQAMACGLAVVSTPVGGIAEIVQHEETGIIVQPHDPEALRVAIERLVGDSALRTGLGEAGRDQAIARFSDTLMIDRMEKIFLEAVRAPRTV